MTTAGFSHKVFGILTDDQGRCVHYHTQLDVIANRCASCRKLYACYKCHDESEDHTFEPVDKNEPDSVMCCVCKKTFSYEEYHNLCQCPECSSAFNPRCALHKEIYAK